MRAVLLTFLLAIAVAGCAAGFVHREASVVAARVGLPQEEVIALARAASARYKRPIAWIRMAGKPDAAFEVGLSDEAKSPHGIIIVFRKIDGRWKEDSELQGSWIA